MKDRVCLVTGANTGIGAVTAAELARRGARVILACRSEEKTRPVLEAIQEECGAGSAEFLALDLASLASVRRAAEEILRRDTPIHVLINNAGLAGKRGLTEDGFEMAFGVNHLGHFLLTQLLLPRLRESTPARIVTVSSKGHLDAKGIDWEAVSKPTRSIHALPEYNVSKLANVLFSAELGRRLEGSGITTYALHPGVIASDVWRQVPWPFRSLIKLFMISTEEGAKTTLHCATSPEAAAETGLYYDECKPRNPSRVARDPDLAKELWRRSEEWCRV